MSSNELGLFLRSRREAVTPAQVGLPDAGRRRTPGLRRAELATLAGVSVEYLIRLEQGRDRRPSYEVITALADALRLPPPERVHLYRLTKAADPGFHCMGGAHPNREVRPTVRAMLERLEPTPAAVVNRLTEVLAYTGAYRDLMAGTGLLDAGLPANVARYVFTDPRARAVHPDWDHRADTVVAALKAGPVQGDALVSALVEELTVTAGPEFARRLAAVPSLPNSNGAERLSHPDAGELRLSYETLDLSGDDQQLVVYLPADPATSAALDALVGRRPGGLRAVSG
ncbi:MAG: helix-turn-helix domain-containing protein [Mycobacteriaceae bacterium]|nr:helix-turn-helix domain-containing protein [Mycobacteriaceae bacterium]